MFKIPPPALDIDTFGSRKGGTAGSEVSNPEHAAEQRPAMQGQEPCGDESDDTCVPTWGDPHQDLSDNEAVELVELKRRASAVHVEMRRFWSNGMIVNVAQNSSGTSAVSSS